jgi:hypothetical protein
VFDENNLRVVEVEFILEFVNDVNYKLDFNNRLPPLEISVIASELKRKRLQQGSLCFMRFDAAVRVCDKRCVSA